MIWTCLWPLWKSHIGLSPRTNGGNHILALCETHRAGLWVLTMLYCGLRPGETIPLTWSDIDFKRSVFKITKAYERGSGEFKLPKSKAGNREIPIPGQLMDKLKATQPQDKPFDFIFQQCDHTKDKKPNGKHHTETSLNSLWRDYKTDLDILMGAKFEERGQRKKMSLFQLSLMIWFHIACVIPTAPTWRPLAYRST